jgi:predicted PurR-regulated permease PerM
LVLGFLFVVRDIYPPFIVGAIIAYLLLPIVNKLSTSTKISMRLAVTSTYLLFLATVAVLVWWFGPRIAEQCSAMVADRHDLVSKLISQMVVQFNWQVDVDKATDDVLASIENTFGQPQELMHIGGLVSRSMLSLLVTIVSSIYFIVDSKRVGSFFLRFVPEGNRHTALVLLRQMNAMLSRYVRGQLILITIMAVAAYLFLHFVFGLKYALLIAILSGFLEIIPVLGPILATTTATFMGISQIGFNHGIWIIAVYTGARWAEDYIVIPGVIGHAVDLHPLAVIFAVLCGEVLAGALGMLIAIPVAASIKVVLDALYPPVPKDELEPHSTAAFFDPKPGASEHH